MRKLNVLKLNFVLQELEELSAIGPKARQDHRLPEFVECKLVSQQQQQQQKNKVFLELCILQWMAWDRMGSLRMR